MDDVTVTQLFARMDAHLARQDAHLERQDAHLAAIQATLARQNETLAAATEALKVVLQQAVEMHAATMRGFAGLTARLEAQGRRAGGEAP
jgi:hypothetical protein